VTKVHLQVKQSKKSTELLDAENEGIMILQNVGKYIPITLVLVCQWAVQMYIHIYSFAE